MSESVCTFLYIKVEKSLQNILFCFYFGFTQCPNNTGIWVYSFSDFKFTICHCSENIVPQTDTVVGVCQVGGGFLPADVERVFVVSTFTKARNKTQK